MRLSKARTAMATCVAAVAALMIVMPGSTGALASRLIGSEGIQDNSVRSVDIRNSTIASRDVKDGSLRARDLAAALRGKTGAAGARGPAGTDGAAGPAGPAGAPGLDAQAGLTGFAYISNSSPQTVAIEADVSFDSNGVMLGVTHAPGTTGVMVTSPGIYEVAFSVAGVEPNQFTLFRNGAELPGSTFTSHAGTQQNNGHVLATLAAGDVISLVNHTSVAAVTLQTFGGGIQQGTNASVLIKRLA